LQPERSLRWEGCCNIRDLGGLPLEGGGETRFRVVVRADTLFTLSEAGWKALEAYGVRRIIDLRHENDERYEAPQFDVVQNPLANPGTFAEIDDLLADVGDPVDWRRRNYLFFLDRFADRFGRAVSAVAEVENGPVVVHCAGGVDRTGLVSALILRTVGVGVDTIAADYAESEANWAPWADEWIAEAPDETERGKRRMLTVMPPRAMRDVLVELEQEHGTVDGYLRDAGVDQGDLNRIRTRLRG